MSAPAHLKLAKIRDVAFAKPDVLVERRNDGVIVLRSPVPHHDIHHRYGDFLKHWAERSPDACFLAQRGDHGEWIRISYGEMWRRSAAVGQALLDRGMGVDTPLALLSGNSLEHAVMMFGALLVGVPVAPVSPAYSLNPEALPRLKEVAAVLKPAAVFVQQVAPFALARSLPELAGVEWISAEPGIRATALRELEAATPGPSFTTAYNAVGPHSVAKILFTSGSTGAPKGVINTHRMLCSGAEAQQAVINIEPQSVTLLNWLPWHHTMGGNAIISGALANGGTLYIDDGRPTPAAFAKTVRNLSEISPSAMLNVPLAYQYLAEAMSDNPALCRSFFKKLQYLSSAGASLSSEVRAKLEACAVATVGERIPFISAYGTTETAPEITMLHWFTEGVGEIGLPIVGVELKLIPAGDRYEARVRGPNVTPGYLQRPDLTAAAFDEEGFYRLGDALQFVDSGSPVKGLRFAGRLAENFKLSNGTWVLVGELRLAILRAAYPFLQDAVIAGHDRNDIRLLIWPNIEACRNSLPTAPSSRGETPIHADPIIVERIRIALTNYNQVNQETTRRIAAFQLLGTPPSLGEGEITDKGSVNQSAALRCRAEAVADLYAELSPAVIGL